MPSGTTVTVSPGIIVSIMPFTLYQGRIRAADTLYQGRITKNNLCCNAQARTGVTQGSTSAQDPPWCSTQKDPSPL